MISIKYTYRRFVGERGSRKRGKKSMPTRTCRTHPFCVFRSHLETTTIHTRKAETKQMKISISIEKKNRECPELAQPSLGLVTLGGRHFGQRASYSCPHGYHVVGLQSRLCQADGNWAGAEPACKQNIYCLKPPNIEHARNSALPDQETFDLDSTVQYHCHNGYVTNGFPRAKCLAIDGQASWYGPDIQCEPRSCGQPPDPANGWHSGECYTFGCKITYNCGTGYELVGKHERTCQSDGSWTPKELPTCVSKTDSNSTDTKMSF